MKERLASQVRQRREVPRQADVQRLLRGAGLRSTGHRIALADALLRAPDRRVTAEMLYDEVHGRRYEVSRATVCATLRQFEHAGLLRRMTVEGSKKAWFAVNRRITNCHA
jgi:Fe2+ or Zn2+ uptake regulation protein